MLDPTLYYTVYLTIVTIYTIFLSLRYNSYPNQRINNTIYRFPVQALILALFMAVFIGLRPRHFLFTDMGNYIEQFAFLSHKTYEYDLNATNKIFDNFIHYLATHGYDTGFFFLSMAFLYFSFIFIGIKKLFYKDTLYAFVIYLGAFSTFSYGTNGIKAGVAAAIFITAIAYHAQKLPCIILLLLSIGFHHAMVLPVIAFAICYFYRKPKVFLVGWALSILIAVAHITYFQSFFGGMTDESGATYLTLSDTREWASFRTGFRLDFIIYSAFPIVVGYYVIFKKKYSSRLYNWIYCTYILTNAIWLLCMYANFTNRIAYLSWLMLPIVLVYPFFDKIFVINQYKKLNVLAWAHLGFTIFMQVIYYGFIK